VYIGDRRIGVVTSGAKSPSLDSFIALALLERGTVTVDDEVTVDLKGRRRRAVVVKTPFYKRNG
jgi:aminomethyltransferase